MTQKPICAAKAVGTSARKTGAELSAAKTRFTTWTLTPVAERRVSCPRNMRMITDTNATAVSPSPQQDD